MRSFAREVEQLGSIKESSLILQGTQHVPRCNQEWTNTHTQSPLRILKNGESESEANILTTLFKSFDFYITFVKEALLKRFGPFREQPLCWFLIFDVAAWPTDEAALAVYGDKEVQNLFHHFREVFTFPSFQASCG